MKIVSAFLAAFAIAALATPALATGKAVAGMPVSLSRNPSGIIANGTTTKDGAITMGKLAPGSYELMISGRNFTAAIVAIAPDAPKGQIAVDVTIDGKVTETLYPYRKGVQLGLQIPFTVAKNAPGVTSARFVFTAAFIQG
jgi:hypothetical protein